MSLGRPLFASEVKWRCCAGAADVCFRAVDVQELMHRAGARVSDKGGLWERVILYDWSAAITLIRRVSRSRETSRK